jgi:hypothetical protein
MSGMRRLTLHASVLRRPRLVTHVANGAGLGRGLALVRGVFMFHLIFFDGYVISFDGYVVREVVGGLLMPFDVPQVDIPFHLSHASTPIARLSFA